MAAVIVGLLGVAVAGIWPLPGPAGNLAGLRINAGAGLLCLAAGALLLAAAGRPPTRPRDGGSLPGG
jgi:hypothetical protein